MNDNQKFYGLGILGGAFGSAGIDAVTRGEWMLAVVLLALGFCSVPLCVRLEKRIDAA